MTPHEVLESIITELCTFLPDGSCVLSHGLLKVSFSLDADEGCEGSLSIYAEVLERDIRTGKFRRSVQKVLEIEALVIDDDDKLLVTMPAILEVCGDDFPHIMHVLSHIGSLHSKNQIPLTF